MAKLTNREYNTKMAPEEEGNDRFLKALAEHEAVTEVASPKTSYPLIRAFLAKQGLKEIEIQFFNENSVKVTKPDKTFNIFDKSNHFINDVWLRDDDASENHNFFAAFDNDGKKVGVVFATKDYEIKLWLRKILHLDTRNFLVITKQGEWYKVSPSGELKKVEEVILDDSYTIFSVKSLWFVCCSATNKIVGGVPSIIELEMFLI